MAACAMLIGRTEEKTMKIAPIAASLAIGLLFAVPAAAQDRSFADEDVQRAKTFFQGSIGSGRDCLVTLNEGMRVLFDNRSLRLSSTVDLTMKKLAQAGLAAPATKFGFFDEKGRSTYGVTAPKTLRNSVWDGLISMSGGGKGWFAYGFSPLDGNHSVTLFLDATGDNPVVYWADQWASKGGRSWLRRESSSRPTPRSTS
jgi:hypothetical protein